MLYYEAIDSPIGVLYLVAGEDGLRAVHFEDEGDWPAPQWQRDTVRLRAASDQLRAYFAGELQSFELSLAARGTDFQRQVWHALMDIPYGETTSYGELARRLGRPHASRAVGAANGQNPLAIIVPCHRVIGANGRLTGYAGGLPRKAFLLQHERRYDDRPLVLSAPQG